MIPILSGNVASALGGAYEVANSCRFNDGDSAYLSKTYSGSGNKKTQTISVWVKRTTLGNNQSIFSSYDSGSSFAFLRIRDDDKLQYYNNSDVELETNRVFRDPSAFYHICVTVDTTQGVAANRVKIYVNGTQETSFATATYPAEDAEVKFADDNLHEIGRHNTSDYFDGYMSEFVFVDGQALAPTSFGEFDDDSPTIWKPKDVSGLSLGTNGFYLDFEDSSDLGADAKGSFDFTANNLAAADQTTDTPTNNFATLNPLGFAGTTPTFSQGNLNVVCGTGVSLYSVSTIGVSSGKWYAEGEIEASSADSGTYYTDFGFADRTDSGGTAFYVSAGRMFWHSSNNGTINYRTGGTTTANLVTSLATFVAGDFFQLYLDMDNELMYWGKNGSLLNSTGVSFNGKESLTGEYFFAFGDQYANGTTEYALNFGQGSIDGNAVSNYQDANGYGNFKYNPSVTTDEGDKDFLALCTKNLGSDGG